jgi:hypothetical protein
MVAVHATPSAASANVTPTIGRGKRTFTRRIRELLSGKFRYSPSK